MTSLLHFSPASPACNIVLSIILARYSMVLSCKKYYYISFIGTRSAPTCSILMAYLLMAFCVGFSVSELEVEEFLVANILDKNN